MRFSLLLAPFTASRALIAGTALLAFPLASQGQSVALGGDLTFTKPVGEFGQNVKQGFGLSGVGVIAKRGSPIGLRFDLNYINYGSKTQRSWFDAFFGSYAIDRTTLNNIISVGIGPQLMVPTGPIRPYINGQVGFSHYYTQTSFEGINSDFFETTRTESSTWKLSYGGGGGFLIPISAGMTPVTINVGAQYYVSGRTTYLTKDDIHPDEETGRITITPRTTDVRYITYRLGMTIAF